MIGFQVFDCPSSSLILGQVKTQQSPNWLENLLENSQPGVIFAMQTVNILPLLLLHLFINLFRNPWICPQSLPCTMTWLLDLALVFSKHHVLWLLPHHPYDCSIDLQPGAPLPSSCLYNLSHPEQKQQRPTSETLWRQVSSGPRPPR